MNNSYGTNILKWYPFKENSKILEIYDENSIIDKLGKRVEVEKQQIKNLNIKEKYDYITLIGTYEYAPIIINGEKPYANFLKRLSKHLNENGKILLAVDNRLGIKYYAGAKSKYYSKIFESIESEIRQNKPNLLLKKELEKFIKEAELENYKFYYPVPDYKNTNSIFTDEFLPKSNHSKIVYPVDYEDGSIVIFNEIEAIKQICDNDMFTYFTNSYLVEIGKEKIDNDIKFVGYNNLRKEKYKLILTIGKDEVRKIAENDESIIHIENITKNLKELENLGFKTIERVENQEIISNFMKEEELDKIIVNKIKQGEIEQAYKEIENWYKYISTRLEKTEESKQNIFQKSNIDVPEDITNKMNFVKQGYIDLSFENIFYKQDYVFYDQEWKFENVPLEFILYRAINNLYTYNARKIEPKIKKEEMYNKFRIDEFIMYFEKLEKCIQEEIIDKETLQEYRNKIGSYYKNVENLESNCQKATEDNKILLERCKELEEVRINYERLLNEYNTSKGWKIIKGVRKVLGKEK